MKDRKRLPLMWLSPRSEIWSQQLKFKAWRFVQSFRWINPESVTSEPERSTESKEIPCEEITSIQLSLTPGHSPKWRSCRSTSILANATINRNSEKDFQGICLITCRKLPGEHNLGKLPENYQSNVENTLIHWRFAD